VFLMSFFAGFGSATLQGLTARGGWRAKMLLVAGAEGCRTLKSRGNRFSEKRRFGQTGRPIDSTW
jgi:hypothetical protein